VGGDEAARLERLGLGACGTRGEQGKRGKQAYDDKERGREHDHAQGGRTAAWPNERNAHGRNPSGQ
jgi:hypothetical protein